MTTAPDYGVLTEELLDPAFRGEWQHLRSWKELDRLTEMAAEAIRNLVAEREGLEPGDIIVRQRHGKWMADLVGATDHSGGWSDPVDAVRGVKKAARALSGRGKA